MDNLHVNSEFAAIVVKHKDTDTAAARLKGTVEARPQVGLVNNSKSLLDISSLSHGDNVAVLHVKNAVLLEYRSKHCLHNNARGGVGYE